MLRTLFLYPLPGARALPPHTAIYSSCRPLRVKTGWWDVFLPLPTAAPPRHWGGDWEEGRIGKRARVQFGNMGKNNVNITNWGNRKGNERNCIHSPPHLLGLSVRLPQQRSDHWPRLPFVICLGHVTHHPRCFRNIACNISNSLLGIYHNLNFFHIWK